MIEQKTSDSELLSRFLQGQESAFGVLVNRYEKKVLTSIYFIVKDRAIAEDILQDTFIKAFNTLRKGGYNEEGKFLPWISRIANNLAIDWFRSKKRRPVVRFRDGSSVENSLNFSESTVEDRRIAAEQQAFVRDCIRQLPEEQRQVVIMRHYQDLSFKEIAEITGVSINTALGRMRYGLINLRKIMNNKQYAYDENFYPGRFDPVHVPGNLGRGNPSA